MNWLCAVWASGRLEAAGCGIANTAICHPRARAAAPVAVSDMLRVAGIRFAKVGLIFIF